MYEIVYAVGDIDFRVHTRCSARGRTDGLSYCDENRRSCELCYIYIALYALQSDRIAPCRFRVTSVAVRLDAAGKSAVRRAGDVRVAGPTVRTFKAHAASAVVLT